MTRQEAVDKAVKYFEEGYACSQSVLLAFAEELKLDPRVAKLISGTFGGGMGRLRNKCGALTGSFMVLGLAQGYDDPKDMDGKMESYKKVRELNKRLEDEYGTSNCNELLIKYSKPENVQARSHHKDICWRLVASAAGNVWDILNAKE